jgi:hypothetical protein
MTLRVSVEVTKNETTSAKMNRPAFLPSFGNRFHLVNNLRPNPAATPCRRAIP